MRLSVFVLLICSFCSCQPAMAHDETRIIIPNLVPPAWSEVDCLEQPDGVGCDGFQDADDLVVTEMCSETCWYSTLRARWLCEAEYLAYRVSEDRIEICEQLWSDNWNGGMGCEWSSSWERAPTCEDIDARFGTWSWHSDRLYWTGHSMSPSTTP